jgi:hypothetical protein
VAGRVPPGPGEPHGAVVAPSVVVTVDGAELGSSSRKAFAEVRAEAVVEDPVGSQCVGLVQCCQTLFCLVVINGQVLKLDMS